MSFSEVTGNIVNTALSVVGGVARYAPAPISSFASQLTSSSSAVDIAPEYRDLLQKQLQSQTELQQVTLYSNIERSQHESRMAAVRNIRVG